MFAFSAIRSFGGLIVTLMSEDFKLRSYLVQCSFFASNHTAQNIATWLIMSLRSVAVRDPSRQLFCVTIDGAANGKAAVRDHLKPRFCLICVAHQLQRAVLKATGRETTDEEDPTFLIEDTVRHMRDFVVYLRTSTKAWSSLSSQFRAKNKPILDVPTRWWSLVDMLRSARDLYPSTIRARRAARDQRLDVDLSRIPDGAVWIDLPYILAVLEPVAEVQKLIEGEKYAVASLALLEIIILKSMLNDPNHEYSVIPLGETDPVPMAVKDMGHSRNRADTLISILVNELDERFPDPSIHDECLENTLDTTGRNLLPLYLAALVDPHIPLHVICNSEPTRDAIEKSDIFEKLKTILEEDVLSLPNADGSEYVAHRYNPESLTPAEQLERRKRLALRGEELKDATDGSQEVQCPRSKEVSTFLSWRLQFTQLFPEERAAPLLSDLKHGESLLAMWRTTLQRRFPSVARVARIYFSTLPTEANIERLFSMASSFLRNQTAYSMSPETAESLIQCRFQVTKLFTDIGNDIIAALELEHASMLKSFRDAELENLINEELAPQEYWDLYANGNYDVIHDMMVSDQGDAETGAMAGDMLEVAKRIAPFLAKVRLQTNNLRLPANPDMDGGLGKLTFHEFIRVVYSSDDKHTASEVNTAAAPAPEPVDLDVESEDVVGMVE